MANNSNKVQTRITEYDRWVVQGLIGFYGKNESDVLSRVVSDWVQSNQDLLGPYTLTIAHFMEHKQEEKKLAQVTRDGKILKHSEGHVSGKASG